MPVVGTSQIRKDAEAKARGRASYVDDLVVPGMLHACAVRTEAPRLAIESVDSSGALADPRVVAVLTAADIPGRNVVPIIFEDWPFLAEREARHHGEAVALVAAETLEAARAAALRVDVRARELPAVVDFETAQEADRPEITRLGGEHNLFKKFVVRKGDVDQALRNAAVVVEGTYRTGYQEHIYLEPQGMLVVPEADGTVTVRGSMQCPFYVQKAVAVILGWPLGRVRVVVQPTGGGFGGKEDQPSLVAGHAALLAVRTGRPVKFVLERSEDIVSTTKRHPAMIQMTHGADAQGRLVAVRARYLVDAGAYAGISSVVLWRGTVHAAGPYVVPNVDLEGRAVATHRCCNGAFRGFGQPQVSFAAESQMDRLAERLGMDPLDVRLVNGLEQGKETATRHALRGSVGLKPALRKAAELSEWAERRAELQGRAGTPGPDGRLHGIGLSCLYYGVGLGALGKAYGKAGANVQVCSDGSVQVAVGTTEMGQGAETVLAQVAADALGCRYDRVQMLPVDTALVPDSGPTVASRATTMSGNAIVRAAEKLKARMHDVAAHELGCRSDELVSADGGVFVRAEPTRCLTFDQVAGKCYKERVSLCEQGFWAVPGETFDEATGLGDAYQVYTFVANVVELAIDPFTAEVQVLRMTSVYDVKPVNPVLIEGQVQGGLLQGVGWALTENLVSREGRIVTDSMTTYLVPGTGEVPEFRVGFTPAEFEDGPFGAKGMGETPILAVAPAIASAVAMATGYRPERLPILPEDLLGRITREKLPRS